MNIYKELINLKEANKDGFTIVLHNNTIKPFNESRGYIISFLTLMKIKGNKIIKNKIYFDKNQYNIIGGWMDKTNNTYYIELNTIVYELNKAFNVAKKYNQKAIYDIKNKKVLYV